MTYVIAKYILYILLCIPFLVFALYLFAELVNNAWVMHKNEKSKALEKREQRLKRKAFDEEYDRKHRSR